MEILFECLERIRREIHEIIDEEFDELVDSLEEDTGEQFPS